LLSLISILSAATVFVFVMGLMMKGESALVDDRLDNVGGGRGTYMASDLDLSLWQRVVVPCWNRAGETLARYVPSKSMENIAVDLERAGIHRRIRPAHFVAYRVAGIVVFATAAYGISIALGAEAWQPQPLVVAAGIVGFLLPRALLARAISDRQRAIVRSLADCIDLLVVCVEAGLGLDAAMDQVVKRMSGPVSEEFERTLDDIAIGRGRMDALRGMAQRTGVSQISVLVAALYQAELLGVSIAHVLRVQSESLRVQRNHRAREAAAKIPLKLLFPLVLCILPAMFVVVLAPGAIQIYKALSGLGK
jgi:tight adherence protein C